MPPKNSFGLLQLTNSRPTSCLSSIIMPKGISAILLFTLLSGYHGFATTHLRSFMGYFFTQIIYRLLLGSKIFFNQIVYVRTELPVGSAI
jgi:hypothetical protein